MEEEKPGIHHTYPEQEFFIKYQTFYHNLVFVSLNVLLVDRYAFQHYDGVSSHR